jgi:hypothetical protein
LRSPDFVSPSLSYKKADVSAQPIFNPSLVRKQKGAKELRAFLNMLEKELTG